jgi:ubiquinone/menaquinone biosynthesis C-methylase UbiE
MKIPEKLLLSRLREACIPLACGKVLELGIGTGANLPYYNFVQVEELTGLDIRLSNTIVKKAKKKFTLTKGTAESLPYADNSFDTVVVSLILCSVHLDRSVNEIIRVLNPQGKLIFIEHILPEDRKFADKLNRINKVWSFLACGCNLNKETDKKIEQCFDIEFMIKELNGFFCYGVAKKIGT